MEKEGQKEFLNKANEASTTNNDRSLNYLSLHDVTQVTNGGEDSLVEVHASLRNLTELENQKEQGVEKSTELEQLKGNPSDEVIQENSAAFLKARATRGLERKGSKSSPTEPSIPHQKEGAKEEDEETADTSGKGHGKKEHATSISDKLVVLMMTEVDGNKNYS